MNYTDKLKIAFRCLKQANIYSNWRLNYIDVNKRNELDLSFLAYENAGLEPIGIFIDRTLYWDKTNEGWRFWNNKDLIFRSITNNIVRNGN